MHALLPVLAAVLIAAASGGPEPSPDLSPEAVVRIQVEALQANDEPHDDAGIATAFRFASPGNRAATGPLARFSAMVHGPAYRDLLGSERATYGPMVFEGDEAAQAVTLVHADGRRALYVFALSRQRGGPYDGCWMTDAVVPREAPESPLRRV